ncbi:hypothetical protein CEW46_27650 [Bacillus cereus]|nr:hypothetical protein CEW46_27650 [Bacillus cereus]
MNYQKYLELVGFRLVKSKHYVATNNVLQEWCTDTHTLQVIVDKNDQSNGTCTLIGDKLVKAFRMNDLVPELKEYGIFHYLNEDELDRFNKGQLSINYYLADYQITILEAAGLTKTSREIDATAPKNVIKQETWTNDKYELVIRFLTNQKHQFKLTFNEDGVFKAMPLRMLVDTIQEDLL